ncbi:MAG: protein tyrosine phosphatase, partial [Thermoanaerobaculia bacterium]
MPEVLVVCTANICRSPVVEAILRSRLEEKHLRRPRKRDWRVVSAGTVAFPGYPAAEHSAAVMADLGFDLGGHRSQPTDERRMAAADLV